MQRFLACTFPNPWWRWKRGYLDRHALPWTSTATLAAVAGKTTYLCGFSIRANATGAATGDATVTGTISGTLNFAQWTAPLASGIGIVEPPIVTCIPASAINTSISVVSAASGSSGTVSVVAWGYQQ